LQLFPTSDRNEKSQAVDKYWMEGGYPEPWLRDTHRFKEVWYEQYLRIYVERDEKVRIHDEKILGIPFSLLTGSAWCVTGSSPAADSHSCKQQRTAARAFI